MTLNLICYRKCRGLGILDLILGFLQEDPVSSIWCHGCCPRAWQAVVLTGCQVREMVKYPHLDSEHRRRVRAARSLWEAQLRACLPSGLSLQERTRGRHMCLFTPR